MGQEVNLYVGYRLRQAADPLTPMSFTEVAARIESDAGLRSQTESLRNLLKHNPQAYRQQKTLLPYFCVSAFRQNLRRIEHFEAAFSMTVDVDWGATDQIMREEFRQLMFADERCVLAYKSPSNTNWRLVFTLLRPITQANVYKAVYRRLLSELQERYIGVRGLDPSTCDCTRANFLAHDPEVKLNLQARPLDWEVWMRDLGPSVFGAYGFGESPTATTSDGAGLTRDGNEVYNDLMADQGAGVDKGATSHLQVPYREIRKTLAPARQGNLYHPVSQGKPNVPLHILIMIPAWQQALATAGYHIIGEKGIAHGLKVRVRRDRKEADVTIYYGKSGFKFVVGAQAGADGTLGQEVSLLLEDTLYAGAMPDEQDAAAHDASQNSFLSIPPFGKTVDAALADATNSSADVAAAGDQDGRSHRIDEVEPVRVAPPPIVDRFAPAQREGDQNRRDVNRLRTEAEGPWGNTEAVKPNPNDVDRGSIPW